jgi:hypothetical protein
LVLDPGAHSVGVAIDGLPQSVPCDAPAANPARAPARLGDVLGPGVHFGGADWWELNVPALLAAPLDAVEPDAPATPRTDLGA